MVSKNGGKTKTKENLKNEEIDLVREKEVRRELRETTLLLKG